MYNLFGMSGLGAASRVTITSVPTVSPQGQMALVSTHFKWLFNTVI